MQISTDLAPICNLSQEPARSITLIAIRPNIRSGYIMPGHAKWGKREDPPFLSPPFTPDGGSHKVVGARSWMISKRETCISDEPQNALRAVGISTARIMVRRNDYAMELAMLHRE